jgi:hypothetical protein
MRTTRQLAALAALGMTVPAGACWRSTEAANRANTAPSVATRPAAPDEASAPSPPRSASRQVELQLWGLGCYKTTESGADEVYIVTVGRRSDGATFNRRSPGETPKIASGHWDMNDQGGRERIPPEMVDPTTGDARVITKKSLFIGELEPGQSWDLVVLVLEEDGESSLRAQQVAGEMLVSTGNPYAVAAGAVLTVLAKLQIGITDTDDYLGSFAVRIANDEGEIKYDWRRVDRIDREYPTLLNFGEGSPREYRLRGDGTEYDIQLVGRS